MDPSTALGSRQRRGEALAFARAEESARAKATVTKAVDELRALYGFAGSLNQAEARALIERRRTATAAIVAALSKADAAGIQAIADAYRAAESGKEKLMLIQALSENPSPEAARAMADLFQTEETFSYRRALIDGIGGSTAPNAKEIAATLVADAPDARERVSALKALPSEASSVPTLIASAQGDPDVSVRISAVTHLAQIGGQDALATLDALVGGAEEPVRLRAAAVQALARAYPDQALATLEPLVADPQSRVRAAVVRALERINSDAAVQLLEAIAQEDADAAVRASAASALVRLNR